MNSKENNFVSAVVYMHKSSENIYGFFETINKTLNDNFKKYEIICVNDGCSTETIKRVKEFSANNISATISIVNMGWQQGLEAAMAAGVDLSIGDYVFEFDSSYIDYDCSLIMEIYKKALEGYDIVSAVPPRRTMKWSSKLFYSIFNRFSNIESKLTTERFRIISRRAINRVESYGKTNLYRKAIYVCSGLHIINIKYECISEPYGTLSKDSERSNTSIDALVLFTNFAYRISFSFAILMMLFLVGVCIWIVISYFGTNKPVPGWAPMMGVISVGFFALLLVFTIVIKYLDLLLKLIFKKQKYLVSSIERL